MRYWLGIAICIISLLSSTSVVFAHANLSQSDPLANASLDASPTTIRLWFTEPLEAEFSRFTLRDSNGTIVTTPSSEVDPVEKTQMVMQPLDLPDGLYTVSWRVLSTDGHSTEGSFAFGNGVAVASTTTPPAIDETIPPDSVIIRWINLLSLSLAVGSIAFWRFVWLPSVPEGQPLVEKRMRLLTWLGWALVGLSSICILLLQVSIAAGIPLLQAMTHPALGTVISSSQYGQIWLGRLMFWLGLGVVLWFDRTERQPYWLTLVLGGQLLLTTSIYSHASSVQQNAIAAIASDWLHLTATSLWIGGLIQFFVVIGSLLRQPAASPQMLGHLTGHFSNFARVTVATLIISGFYAAWLQIGSLEALVTTVYGQTLLLKLLLTLPLLAVSAINLFFTQQGLRQGQNVWSQRLRSLVGVEIVLGVSILGLVGVMTAIAPARTVMAVRNAGTGTTAGQPFFEMQTTENLMAHLEITPGYVGENTFKVTLYDPAGTSLTDATLIRLRFDNQAENIGQSELRPELQPDGTFTITGTNLSIPGNWRVRMTVQRPNEFDSLFDFEPLIVAAPPPGPPVIDMTIPAISQTVAMLSAGLGFLGVGGFFVGRYGLRSLTGPSFVALLSLMVGIVFWVSAASTAGTALTASGELSVQNAWTRPAGQGMTGAVYMTIENGTDQDDRLVGAISDVAESVEIHQTQIENNIVRMQPFTNLALPSGDTVTITPGGYHLMLINLRRDLTVGESIPVTLQFESDTELAVEIPVQNSADPES